MCGPHGRLNLEDLGEAFLPETDERDTAQNEPLTNLLRSNEADNLQITHGTAQLHHRPRLYNTAPAATSTLSGCCEVCAILNRLQSVHWEFGHWPLGAQHETKSRSTGVPRRKHCAAGPAGLRARHDVILRLELTATIRPQDEVCCLLLDHLRMSPRGGDE